MTTQISTSAAAVAVRNRLARDLDELQRAAAGADQLPADDAGVSFDFACNLSAAVKALGAAIADVERYAVAARAAEQAQRVERARVAAAEFNADIFGIAA